MTEFHEPADRLYAVGDIHGRLDLLLALDALIQADIERTRPQAPVICYLGDYIDRGRDSFGVIDQLSAPARPGPPGIFLMGNHEERMLAFLDGDPAQHGPAWLAFGGRDALASYGVEVPPEDGGVPDWEALRRVLMAALPERHLAFVRGLRLSCRWGPYLLVHAGIQPGVPLAQQSPHDLLWIREPFLSSTDDHGAVVVHGHVPSPEPVVRPNRIGVDTRAWRSGRLTAAVLGEGVPRFLHTTSPIERDQNGNQHAPAPSHIHGA